MRVPRPPAITTAASLAGLEVTGEMAGAPGFEPGIAGPKPAALPLGYAPSGKGSLRARTPARAVGEEEDQGEHGERDHGREQQPLGDQDGRVRQMRPRLRRWWAASAASRS